MSRRIDKEEAAHLQYETEHTEPPKSRSVIVYMAILVAAAFLLLLLAYFMQMRTADTVAGLHQSVNSFQTIDQLVEDNRLLQEEADRLKEENAALTQERDALQGQLEAVGADLFAAQATADKAEGQAAALNKLNQIRSLYNEGRYREAKEVLAACPPDIEDALLELAQDDLSPAELEIYDPLASYQRFAKLLGVD